MAIGGDTSTLMRVSLAVIVAALAPSLQAHHASSSIDLSTPIFVKGTVVRFDRINPHTIIELDEAVGTGLRRWRIEGPFLARLKRMGADERLLEAGDAVEVCGFPPKGAAPDAPRLIHGRVIALPSGQLRLWGPYGKIDNCVRPADDRQRWLELLRSDPLARDSWCEARAALPMRAEPKSLVDEIDRSLTQRCP